MKSDRGFEGSSAPIESVGLYDSIKENNEFQMNEGNKEINQLNKDGLSDELNGCRISTQAASLLPVKSQPKILYNSKSMQYTKQFENGKFVYAKN